MRSHISLTVHDVAASAAFYENVFGLKPQKQTEDYAKFDLTRPPLNLSLVSLEGVPGNVHHFGIEVDSPSEVTTWEQHLHERGIPTMVENDVNCCYARQHRVWFTDPDGNPWEVFFVDEQLPVTKPLRETSCCASTCCSGGIGQAACGCEEGAVSYGHA